MVGNMGEPIAFGEDDSSSDDRTYDSYELEGSLEPTVAAGVSIADISDVEIFVHLV